MAPAHRAETASDADEQINAELADFVSQFYDDPLGFVVACYPWGEPGPLEQFDGPDTWQRECLTWIGEQVRARKFDGVSPVEPLKAAIASGHGIGKSTMQAWLVNWIMSTRPYCRGTVTANTATQLDTKTWAAIQHWAKLCLTAPWFEINSNRYYYKGQRENWFCAPQSCREENSEAFAGQHAASSTSFYVFDEASAIADAIYDVAQGGVTDGEPMWFLFGNPTRSSGAFHRCCFGSERHRWKVWCIDSRESKFTNKTQIAEWVTDYGEDSDFVRVRVRGLPPKASDLQFIGHQLVMDAQKRSAFTLPDEPLIAGLDLARGGSDECVIRFRRGIDARTIPPIRLTGEQARDSMKLVSIAADVLERRFDGQQVRALFVDATGGSIGGPVADRLRQLGHRHVYDVQFGGESPEPTIANMRAYMWSKLRDWLARGAIDASPDLEIDLVGPGYGHDKQDRLLLESKESMKKRGLDSPDDGDALALTFAQVVAPRPAAPVASNVRPSAWG
ncbi:MAG: terminase [Candidatus Eisenbacteria bacterium]|nr:terminase [Candidatus Eisenbacteria bacterium]